MTYNYPGVSQEYLNMRIFPLELKEWFKSVGQDVTSWSEMKKCFLRKIYSFGQKMPLGEQIGNSAKVMVNFLRLRRHIWP